MGKKPENDKIGKTQAVKDHKRPVFSENSPGEPTGAAQCVVKCTAKGLCEHLPQDLEAETGEKKCESRTKLEKKTPEFRSQELGSMRREDPEKLQLDEKKESKGKEQKC